MIVMRFGTRLGALSWARTLRDVEHSLGERWWHEGALTNEHISVDLSEVGFADFVTLGHLLIFLHVLTNAGAEFSVSFPQVYPAHGTWAGPSAEAAILRRRNCRLYLDQSGFSDALSDPLIGRSSIVAPPIREAPIPDGSDDESADRQLRPLPRRSRRIMPYRWVPAEEARMLRRAHRPTNVERDLRGLGLSPEDAAALANGVLTTLLENSAADASVSAILLGGVLAEAETYGQRHRDFDPSLHDFVMDSAKAGSPLVRLVVADAGPGLPERSRIGAASTPGASGFWRISQIVRAYHGSVLVSTGGHTWSRTFTEAEGVDRTADFPSTPGTVTECDLRVGSGTDSPLPSTPPATLVDAHAAGEPECLMATLHAGEGLPREDLHRIRDVLAQLPADNHGLVVVINTAGGGDRPDDVDIRRSIRSVLELANDTPEPTAVALAFPSINRPLMTIAVREVNLEHGATAQDTPGFCRRPILVLGPGNLLAWVGGTPATRRALESPGGEEDDAIGPQLPARVAIDAMIALVSNEIAQGVRDEGTRGAWHGEFLTPSLRLTTWWYNFEEILADLDLLGPTGFALAALVQRRLDLSDHASSPLIIQQVGDPPGEMIGAFVRALTGRDEYVDSLDEVRAETPAGEPARLILITSLIDSQRTVIRALTDAVDRGVNPVAVVTIVDARGPSSRESEPDSIWFRTDRLPMVSLAGVDLRPEDPRSAARAARHVDPVLRKPIAAVQAPRQVLLPPMLYVSMLIRGDTIRLGHVGRPSHRHYTAYVDPTRLFRDQSQSARIMRRIVTQVREAHAAVFAPEDDAPVCVLYPGEPSDDIAWVVERLVSVLEESGLKVSRVVPIPRKTDARERRLPSALPIDGALRHAVIVDSTANSGRTLLQLIKLVAGNDVEAITCIVLMAGASDSDALILERMAAVHRATGSADRDAVPLRVRYVVRTAISGIEARDCSICHLREVYRTLPHRVPLPTSLQQHRDWLIRSLEPRSNRLVFQEQSMDLLGANISQRDCMEYVLWRYELREAMGGARRSEVADRLESAQSPMNTEIRDALIRLLVYESQWLRSTPLWIPDYQEIVVKLAVTVLVDNPARSYDSMLCVQAVILLASVAVDRFARELARIFTSNRDRAPVALQAMLEALRLIAGAASADPSLTRLLVDQLNLIVDSLGPQDETTANGDETMWRDTIRYLLSHAKRQLESSATSRQGAWNALRKHYRQAIDSHHHDSAMWRVLLALNLIERGHPPADLDAVWDDWNFCSEYLIRQVLPNIDIVRDLVLDEQTLRGLGVAASGGWERVARGEGTRMLDEIGLELTDLLNGARAQEPPPIRSISQLKEDLNWWTQTFLIPSAEGSALYRLVDNCPADAQMILQDMFRGAELEIVPLPETEAGWPLVFCTKARLRNVFTHIRINAERTHRIPGPQRFRAVWERTDPSHITVTVYNTASAPANAAATGHRGLSVLDRDLRPFGGRVTWPAPVERMWSFGVAMTFEQWGPTP